MSGWPVEFDGIAETVTLTPDPNDRWNVAALGVHAGSLATARTWGRTVTRRNFERTGAGRVLFVDDPVLFVEAALTERKLDDPPPEGAAATVSVDVTEIDRGSEGGTTWVEWALRPTGSRIHRETVPVTNRGFNAIVEMTVAASRLDVPAYDDAVLEDRLQYFEEVVHSCGGAAERRALELIDEVVDRHP
ncbi:MAG: DUF447 domain-containing protein [Halanaeroarchaeum sp.]